MSKKSSEITIKVDLDENHIPENIAWKAPDGGQENFNKCKAFMLAIWDEKENNTLRIDLWDKEMKVDEMKKFCQQSLMTMADTMERATNDENFASSIRKFAQTLKIQ